MESLSHRKTSNFSIAAIMSGIQAKTEPIEAAESDTKNDSKNSASDDSSDNLAGLDKVVVKKEKKSKISEECNCEELSRVNCNLDNKDLWDKFCEFGTEMIITRTGRRMFPTVRITFNDVEQEPGVKYHVVLDIPPCDNKRYRYAYHRSSWLVAGKADPAPPARLHTHPDGPYTADQLKKQVIGFEKVKITNNESDNSGQLILNSMHKFQPRVWLVPPGNPFSRVEAPLPRAVPHQPAPLLALHHPQSTPLALPQQLPRGQQEDAQSRHLPTTPISLSLIPHLEISLILIT